MYSRTSLDIGNPCVLFHLNDHGLSMSLIFRIHLNIAKTSIVKIQKFLLILRDCADWREVGRDAAELGMYSMFP